MDLRPPQTEDVAELLLQRGFEVSYETIRTWEYRFAPMISESLRAKRRGKAGRSWYLDETYIKVSGRWCYLYRAIDRDETSSTQCSVSTVTDRLPGDSCVA